MDTKYNLKEGIPVVRAGKIETLLPILLDKYHQGNVIIIMCVSQLFSEPDFKDLFLFTHPYFIDSKDLLKDLLEMYSKYVTLQSSPWHEKCRARYITQKWLSFIHQLFRITKLMRYWVKTYSYELREIAQDLITEVENFTDNLGKDPEKGPFASFTKRLKKLDDKPLPSVMSPRSSEIVTIQIMDYDSEEVAKQIVLVDHAVFSTINIHECILKRFSRSDQCPTFTAITTRFNEVMLLY